jgi:hypothetical protein
VVGEVLVGEDRAQFIAQVEIGVAVGEGGASDTGCIFGDGNVQLSAQGHQALSNVSERCSGAKISGAVRCPEMG